MNRIVDQAWKNFKEFCAMGAEGTFIWPRWIILRSVGLVYILIFAGIIVDSQALIGPHGIAPVKDIFDALARQHPNPVEAFLRTPSLFWISTAPGMIVGLQWLGLAAAVSLVLNIWPRWAMFGCWLIFLSFAVSGPFFSQTAPDPLMLEIALLCVFLAPPGFRPGPGTRSPPRPVAVFALRWMFFRVMIEAGLSKFVYGSELWSSFRMMDVMHETTPFPTVLGFWDHQLPHAFHLSEIWLTFVAEIVAPVMALLAGRGWRWFAFWVWFVFQLGIELTSNFGWLNLASVALGVVLLDDQMLVGAFRRIRLAKFAGFLGGRVKEISLPAIPPWALWGLRIFLGGQFAVAMFFYLVAPARIHLENVPPAIAQPVILLFGGFRSANAYPLFGSLATTREEVEYIGSSDGGETWRSYDYRFLAQRVDRMCPVIAPWYPRFDHALQQAFVVPNNASLYQKVATHLLRRDPAVLGLFRANPFPDRQPTMIRMPIYRLKFTDARTFLATGHYWRKEYEGEYAPMMYLNNAGEVLSLE